MFFGPQPSKELWEKRPEEMSEVSAYQSFVAGFSDGANNATHVMFEDRDIQTFYDGGYERGEAEKRVVDQINARHGEAIAPNVEEQESQEKPPTQLEEFRNQALAFHKKYQKQIEDTSWVVQAVSFAAIAAALWSRKCR